MRVCVWVSNGEIPKPWMHDLGVRALPMSNVKSWVQSYHPIFERTHVKT